MRAGLLLHAVDRQVSIIGFEHIKREARRIEPAALAEVGFEGGPFARILYFEPGMAFMRCYGEQGFGTKVPLDADPSPRSPFAG